MRLLFLFILLGTGIAATAQDTLRYRHRFKLPLQAQQNGYEKNVSQYPTNTHSFIFEVPDSCMVYITIRSENDSLEIEMGSRRVKLRAKENDLYVYAFAGQLPPGENSFTIRTRQYCRYKVYVKGQQ